MNEDEHAQFICHETSRLLVWVCFVTYVIQGKIEKEEWLTVDRVFWGIFSQKGFFYIDAVHVDSTPGAFIAPFCFDSLEGLRYL